MINTLSISLKYVINDFIFKIIIVCYIPGISHRTLRVRVEVTSQVVSIRSSLLVTGRTERQNNFLPLKLQWEDWRFNDSSIAFVIDWGMFTITKLTIEAPGKRGAAL